MAKRDLLRLDDLTRVELLALLARYVHHLFFLGEL